MDQQFEADEELAVEYKKQMTKAKQQVNQDPKMQEPLIKLWDDARKPVSSAAIKSFLQDKEVVREAYVNKLFLKQAVKHFMMIFNATHHHRYLLARALIQKAQSSGFESKVNEVYHKALVRAGGVSYLDTEDDVISDILFNAIEKGLESEHSLNTEIRVLMKEIEGNTSYDADMLSIDFAPL